MCIGGTLSRPAPSQSGRSRARQRHNRGRAQPGLLPRGWAAGLGRGAGRARTSSGSGPSCCGSRSWLTSATLSLVAAWRLTSASQLLGPSPWPRASGSCSGATLATRGRRSAGEVRPRGLGGQPQQRVLGGSGGDGLRRVDRDDDRRAGQRASPRPGARWQVHLMRRDAPLRQRRATSWVDQSPILASVVGLLLHLVGPAPSWTADVLILAGPLLAFSGAALFTGSVIHPHNLAVPRTAARPAPLGVADRRAGRLLPAGRGGGIPWPGRRRSPSWPSSAA